MREHFRIAPPLGTSRRSEFSAVREVAPFGTSRRSGRRAVRDVAPFEVLQSSGYCLCDDGGTIPLILR